MFAIHVFDVKALKKNSIKILLTSPEVARVLLDLDDEKYPILSNITFIDEELRNGNDLKKIKEEVFQLYTEINNENQKNYLSDLLDIVKLAEELNLWVLFNPFYELNEK